MDFGEMLRVLRRRWIVATVGVLLTLVATLGAYKAWPNEYQTTAQITLVGSKSMADAVGNGGNPYLSVADLDPVASILAGNVASDQAVQQLHALGVTDAYTVVVPQFAAGPFLQITVTGKSAAEVTQQLPIVMRFTDQRMTQLQQETAIPTPPNAIITTQTIVPPSAHPDNQGEEDQARGRGRGLRDLPGRHPDHHRHRGRAAADGPTACGRGPGPGRVEAGGQRRYGPG